jgi:hypothetical protein
VNGQIQHTGRRPPNNLAISGFISSFFCGIVGLVLSLKARGQIRAANGAQGGWGFTTGGIIVSIVNIVVSTLYIILNIAAYA